MTLFGILLPLMAIIDGGRMFYTYLQVVGAARAGAQYGAQGFGTSTDTTGMVQHAKDAAPNVPGLTATATDFCCCPSTDGKSCTAFGKSGATTFQQSCGIDPSTLSKTCSNFADWRKYEQVTATGNFNTIIRIPGVPQPLVFSSSSVLRSR
jgi:Flp pilus assembly protein TadG